MGHGKEPREPFDRDGLIDVAARALMVAGFIFGRGGIAREEVGARSYLSKQPSTD